MSHLHYSLRLPNSSKQNLVPLPPTELALFNDLLWRTQQRQQKFWDTMELSHYNDAFVLFYQLLQQNPERIYTLIQRIAHPSSEGGLDTLRSLNQASYYEIIAASLPLEQRLRFIRYCQQIVPETQSQEVKTFLLGLLSRLLPAAAFWKIGSPFLAPKLAKNQIKMMLIILNQNAWSAMEKTVFLADLIAAVGDDLGLLRVLGRSLLTLGRTGQSIPTKLLQIKLADKKAHVCLQQFFIQATLLLAEQNQTAAKTQAQFLLAQTQTTFQVPLLNWLDKTDFSPEEIECCLRFFGNTDYDESNRKKMLSTFLTFLQKKFAAPPQNQADQELLHRILYQGTKNSVWLAALPLAAFTEKDLLDFKKQVNPEHSFFAAAVLGNYYVQQRDAETATNYFEQCRQHWVRYHEDGNRDWQYFRELAPLGQQILLPAVLTVVKQNKDYLAAFRHLPILYKIKYPDWENVIEQVVQHHPLDHLMDYELWLRFNKQNETDQDLFRQWRSLALRKITVILATAGARILRDHEILSLEKWLAFYQMNTLEDDLPFLQPIEEDVFLELLTKIQQNKRRFCSITETVLEILGRQGSSRCRKICVKVFNHLPATNDLNRDNVLLAWTRIKNRFNRVVL